MFEFCALLGLLVIGLKLTKHIDWPWPLVLAPVWAPFLLLFSGGVFVGMAGM